MGLKRTYGRLEEVASFYENEAHKVLGIVTYWFLHSYYIDNFTEKAGITVNPEYTLSDVIRQMFNLSEKDMRSELTAAEVEEKVALQLENFKRLKHNLS